MAAHRRRRVLHQPAGHRQLVQVRCPEHELVEGAAHAGPADRQHHRRPQPARLDLLREQRPEELGLQPVEGGLGGHGRLQQRQQPVHDQPRRHALPLRGRLHGGGGIGGVGRSHLLGERATLQRSLWRILRVLRLRPAEQDSHCNAGRRQPDPVRRGSLGRHDGDVDRDRHDDGDGDEPHNDGHERHADDRDTDGHHRDGNNDDNQDWRRRWKQLFQPRGMGAGSAVRHARVLRGRLLRRAVPAGLAELPRPGRRGAAGAAGAFRGHLLRSGRRRGDAGAGRVIMVVVMVAIMVAIMVSVLI
mmetsp:Transcript_30078/g.84754  ORF Transcript_30078/g.84754 Transcript_30078/m.84754 type:complete len:302 (-) Transcript_30078:8-913(-)